MPRFPIDYDDRKPLGKTDERVSAIGLGTYGIRNYIAAEEALVHAVELGIDLIDTAEDYGNGLAEELVGRVAKKVGRDRIFIVTKLSPYRFTDPSTAIRATEASLRRMGVNYVDLLLISSPSDFVPIHIMIRSLEAVAEKGLARYIGVSNFSARELKEAIESVSKYEIVANQVKYSVIDRKIERDLLPLCIELGVTVQGYRVIERGAVVRYAPVLEVANRVGKTPIQVAINFVISRPRAIAIVKSESVEHIDEISGALGWRLPAEAIEILER